MAFWWHHKNIIFSASLCSYRRPEQRNACRFPFDIHILWEHQWIVDALRGHVVLFTPQGTSSWLTGLMFFCSQRNFPKGQSISPYMHATQWIIYGWINCIHTLTSRTGDLEIIQHKPFDHCCVALLHYWPPKMNTRKHFLVSNGKKKTIDHSWGNGRRSQP